MKMIEVEMNKPSKEIEEKTKWKEMDKESQEENKQVKEMNKTLEDLKINHSIYQVSALFTYHSSLFFKI